MTNDNFGHREHVNKILKDD